MLKIHFRNNSFHILFLTISFVLNLSTISYSSQLKVMVIIPEYHLSGQNTGQIFQDRSRNRSGSVDRILIPDPAGETEIIRILVNNGYSVVDKSQIEKIRYNNQIKAIINGDNDLAKVLALQYGADLLFIGEAFSQFTGNAFQGLFSCRARIEARIIRSDTGEIIFSDGKYASGIDRSEAIASKKAIQKAGLELGNYCIEKLKTAETSENIKTIELIVTNLKYNEFLLFKKEVLIPTDCVQQIFKSSYVKKRTLLKINLKCNTELLCERMLALHLSHFNIEILDLSGSSLTISAIKK